MAGKTKGCGAPDNGAERLLDLSRATVGLDTCVVRLICNRLWINRLKVVDTDAIGKIVSRQMNARVG
jgi:hypothetical protein